jgi:ribosomal-protein-alanine N-acetyltransferase
MSLFSSPDSLLKEKARKIFENNTILESQDLRYEKIRPEFAPDMYEYSKDDDVTRYLTWSSHTSEKQTQNYCKLLVKKYAQGVFFDWGIIDKNSSKMIGTVGFTSFDGKNNTAEIGYVLSKDFWKKGLATQAARTIIEFGFEQLHLDGFCAKCIQGNDASLAVMKKCGMSIDGIYQNSMFIKGEYKTIIICSVTKEKYYSTFKENK